MPIVYFHNHLLPGVDDGAQTVEEALLALQAFAADGVRAVIVTPHVDASQTMRPSELAVRLAELDEAWEKLKPLAEQAGVRVERGVELLLDVPEPDLSDARLRLAGGRFLLMEFPFMMIPPQSARAVGAIAAAGYKPIIAHPERYVGFASQVELAAEWKASGAFLQVNGGSLLGRYGAEPRRLAFELLERGWVDYLCSDYHARGPTLVNEYRALLESNNALEQSYTLTETNPARLLDGLAPLPVFPLRGRRPTFWGRMTAIFKS
jgi:protein-tyrosine phosphatase